MKKKLLSPHQIIDLILKRGRMSWLIILLQISHSMAFQPCICRNEESKNKAPHSAVCTTPVCREVARQFTASMETTIDPCVNFYQYACGQWASANPKPKYHRAEWDNMARLTLLAQTRLRDELQSAASSSDIQPIQHMKEFYKSCINEKASESDAMNQIQRILEETNGWPMIRSPNQWNINGMTWQTVDEYYSTLLGDPTFYSIDFTEGYWSDYYTLLIQYPLFYADLHKKRGAYRSLIKQIAEALIRQNEAIVSDEQLENDIDDLIKLEDQLYKASGASKTVKEIDDISSFVREWNTMTQNFPQTRIDWGKVFQRILVITNVRPSAKAPVTIKALKYFVELARILQFTNKRIIINFIQWKSLSKILPYTTTKMEDLFYEIDNNINDIQNKPPRFVPSLY